MDDREAGRYWDANADAWTLLARQGWDVYRDFLNTPAFLAMLPEVSGLHGLDLGCGEGHNTRLLKQRGARMMGLDISRIFVCHARSSEDANPICYTVASAQCLPFADASFDFATAFMSLMDMPRPDAALCEAYRVLRGGGFLQFSIVHPCFVSRHKAPNYFEPSEHEIEEWLFSAAPREVKSRLRRFRIPNFRRTLSEWLNNIVDAGLMIERIEEPHADAETAARCPAVACTSHRPYFLHVRCRKPQSQR